jgi:hypothetical protein
VRCPAWWPYPGRCGNGHEWGPGLALVSWGQCHCAGAQMLHADRAIWGHLDDPIASLGDRTGPPGGHRIGGGVGIQRAGLAFGPPLAPVGLADFDHGHALAAQVTGQPGAVGPSALRTNRVQPPE